MANVIKPKRGAGVPTSSNLENGEIGINTSNQSLYYGTGDGVQQIKADNVTGVVGIEHGGTGATTRDKALRNLIIGGVYSGNINDLVIIGTYWINLSKCQNGPSSSGYGTMEVTRSISTNYLQRFTYYTGMVYYRTFTNGQWYDWRMLPDARATEVLWEGSLRTGATTITNGAKYAYLIVGGMAGANSNWVTQIIPNGWGSHMELVDHQNQFLAYMTEISGNNIKLTVLDNRYNGLLQWVWGINQYKE